MIYNEKKEDIGIVTAAMWSPTMKRNVALASLKRPYGIKIKENIFAENTFFKKRNRPKQGRVEMIDKIKEKASL